MSLDVLAAEAGVMAWPIAPPVPLADVSWRIDSAPYERDSSPTGWVARWVPYIDASTVAQLLDEWVGPDNWSDAYEKTEVLGHQALECVITIQFGDKLVTKRDIGVSPKGNDADMDVKGIYSDAFKRCGIIKFGVGRNVYSMQSVWAPVKVRDRDGKKQAVEAAESLPAILEQAASRA